MMMRGTNPTPPRPLRATGDVGAGAETHPHCHWTTDEDDDAGADPSPRCHYTLALHVKTEYLKKGPTAT